jgi:hypothetical protein
MDPIASKLATNLPRPSSSQTPAEKSGASKFDQVRHGLDENGGGAASSKFPAGVNAIGQANRPGASAVHGPASRASSVNQVQQNLSVSQHHLSRLKYRIESSSTAGSMPGIRKHFASIETQFRQLDRAIHQMSGTASPQQLMELQQKVYGINENITTLSKIVDQATSSTKSILQTQL